MTGTGENWRDEAYRILALAWPIALSSLSWTLMQLTDVAVIGQAGTFEVAAFGASRTITFIAIVTGMGWISGLLVNVSRAEGARTPGETGNSLREGLLLALLLGVLIGGIMILSGRELLLAIGVEQHLVPLTAQVVAIMGVTFPIQLVSIALGNFLQAINRSRRTLAINCVTLPVNAVLAWAWAGGHLGFPQAGALGATSATFIASTLGLILSGVSVWFLPDEGLRGVRRLAPDDWARAWRGVPALARFGLAPAFASALELGGFSWVMVKSTQLGLVAAHAFQLVLSMHNVTFGLAMGLGAAAGVRAGNAVGEGRPEAALFRTLIAAAITTAVLVPITGLLMVFARTIVGLYPATMAVHALAGVMLLVWAPFMLFDGLQLVFTYALRSLGDQVVAGLNSIIAFFVVTIALGSWLIASGMGPIALVWCVGISMLVCAGLQGGRLIWFSSPQRLKSSD